jgi:hypothetical protein
MLYMDKGFSGLKECQKTIISKISAEGKKTGAEQSP